MFNNDNNKKQGYGLFQNHGDGTFYIRSFAKGRSIILYDNISTAQEARDLVKALRDNRKYLVKYVADQQLESY